jgi:chromosome segregation ATPase
LTKRGEMLFEDEGNKIKKLSVKIDELLRKYEELKKENESLKNELVSLKASKEAKDLHIKKLEEKISNVDYEGDELLSKIEEVLSR